MLNEAPVPFRIALTMARKSKYYPYRVGACLARGKRVMSAGFNQVKTHPMTRLFQNKHIQGLHAEMHATIGTDEESLSGADIYVVRLCRDGSLGLAKPCEECQRFLKKLGIRKAYFTEAGGAGVKEKLGVMKI